MRTFKNLSSTKRSQNSSKTVSHRSTILLTAALVTLGVTSAVRAQILVGAPGVSYDTTSGDVTETQALIHDPALGATLDGGLTKIGPNSLILTANSTYTGPTTISGGTLRLNSVTLATTNIAIGSGSTLEINGGLNLASKTVTGTGSIVKTGAGSSGFINSNTRIALSAGALIDIQSGFFYGANPNSIPSNVNQNAYSANQSSLNIAAGATFDGGTADIVVAGLTGAGTYQGGSFGSRSLNVGLNDTSSTFDGVIRGNNFGGGTVNLIKVGNGALTLTGNNTFTAGLSVRGGTTASPSIINLNPTSTFAIGAATNSSITIGNSASTDVGILNQNGGVLTGSSLNVGTSGRGTYNLNSGTLNLFGNITTSGDTNRQATLVLNGTVNLNNNASIFMGDFNGGGSAFTTITQTGGTVTFYSDVTTTPGGTGRINLRTAGQYYYLNGGTLAVPRFGFAGQAASNNFGASGNFYLNGGTLRTTIATTDFFGATTRTTGTTAVWNFLVSTNGGTIDTAGNDVTMGRPAAHDSAGAATDGGLTKTGLGTLTLASGISYNGPTTVNQGRLAIAVATGFPTFSSKALSIGGGASLELSIGNGTANAATGGAITVTGTGSLVKTGTNGISLAGSAHRISLSAGGLIDVQAGTFAAADFNSNDTGSFDNLNTWANNQGNINVAAGAIFDTSMATVKAGALSGSGRFLAGYFGGRTFTVGLGDASGTFDGTVSFNGTTTTPPSLIKAGAGTQTFAGQTALTAATVSSGALTFAPGVGNTATIGGGTPFAGGTSISVAPNSSDDAILNISDGTTINATTFSVADTGNAGVGTVNQTGGTVNANRLNLGQSGTNARAAYNLSGGTLNIGSSGILTSVNSSASSALNISGGALNLTSNSSITMGTFGNRPTAITQSAGTVTFYSDNGVTPGGTGRISLSNSDYSGGTYYRLNGGTLSVPGLGYSGQAAANNFGINAALYLNGGTLAPTGSTTDFFGDSTRTTGNGLWSAFAGAGGAIIDTGANDVTFNRPLNHDSSVTTDGGLTKAGSGILTFTAATGYNGPTAVNGGTVVMTAAPASKLITFANGGTLDLTVDGNQTIDNVSVTGTGTLIKRGGGTLQWGNTLARGALSAGSLIDVQAGKLSLNYFNGSLQNSWAGNASDLNIASGATFDANQADLTVGKLTGAGTYVSGWFFYRTLTVGSGDVSSTFDGVIANSGVGGPTVGTTAVTKIGTGTLTFTGAQSYGGPTFVSNGLLLAQQPLRPVTGPLVVTGPGVASLAAPAQLIGNGYTVAGEFSTITASGTASVTVPDTDRSQFNANVVVTKAVSITDSGKIELGTSDLIVNPDASNTSAYSGLMAAVNSGAITASNSAPNTTLAVFLNDAGDGVTPFFTSYDGIGSLTATSIIVKYTYIGDTNLDGKLDGTDLANIIEGYSAGLTGWANGDVDNSGGAVSDTDFASFFAALTYFQANSPADLGNGVGSGTGGTIPEPTSAALLLAVLPFASRRRR